jgi:uncharacterized protein (DUF2126 family)
MYVRIQVLTFSSDALVAKLLVQTVCQRKTAKICSHKLWRADQIKGPLAYLVRGMDMEPGSAR